MLRFIFASCVWAAATAAASAQSVGSEHRERERILAGALKKVLANPRQVGTDALAWVLEREGVRILLTILADTPPTGEKSSGWIVPSRTRYTWNWLSKKLDRDGGGGISPEEFGGPAEWFKILDQDHDGLITAVDLDWSAKSPLGKANASAKMLFRSLDADGNGQATPEEWQAFMDRLAQGKPYLAQDDLMSLFASPARTTSRPNRAAPNVNTAMLQAFLRGDAASIFEGPRPGTRAPDFTLFAPDGKSSITLSERVGKRPIVLVFGSFT